MYTSIYEKNQLITKRLCKVNLNNMYYKLAQPVCMVNLCCYDGYCVPQYHLDSDSIYKYVES